MTESMTEGKFFKTAGVIAAFIAIVGIGMVTSSS
jgi:hypothetical protein